MADYYNRKVSVLLKHGSKTYVPVVTGEITVEWTRFRSPGRMTLTVMKDDTLKFAEGDTVRLKVDDKNFFYGFLFTYERAGYQLYRITCYDALRYLKSKDIFKMKKMTYSNAVKVVCKRFGLSKGTITNTKYVRKAKVFNGTVFDMLEKYRKSTRRSTGTTYILYADYNKVCLRKQSALKTKWIIQANVAEDYTYQSSIDTDVYTVIKLIRKKGKKSKTFTRTVKAAKKKYGRLVYVGTTKVKKAAKIKKKLKKIAQAHDTPRKKLKFNGVFGLLDVRAGSGVTVQLKAVGMNLNKNMVVNTVTHKFKEGVHTMDLTVVGGDYGE